MNDNPTVKNVEGIEGKPLLKVRQVAQQLSVEVQTVYTMASRGELPCMRVGRRAVRFRPEALEKYLKDREKEAYGTAAA